MELYGDEVECHASLNPVCDTALMPHPLHIQMNSRLRRRLRQVWHDPRLRPRERDRVEMCLLSAQVGPGLACTPPGGASGCVRGHGAARDPAVGSPGFEISAPCAQGSSPGGGAPPAGVSSPAPRSAAPADVEFPHAVCGLGDPGSASAAAHGAHVPGADGGQLSAHPVLSAAQKIPLPRPPASPCAKFARPHPPTCEPACGLLFHGTIVRNTLVKIPRWDLRAVSSHTYRHT